MRLPDPAHSRAVLIGASHFSSMEDLPAVTANLDRLAELLGDERVWGLPSEHVVVVPEPASPGEALEQIHRAAAAASDTLLVYYAGHGLLDDGDDLLLALPGTDMAKPFTAIRFDDVRRQVQRNHRRSSKVIILDCCYSARAMAGGMTGDDVLADRAAVEGSYLLVAAAENKAALAPPDETYTAFTGELVTILEKGIENAPDLIAVEQVFWQMHRELLAKGRPLPQQRARHAGASIVLTRNRWSAGPPAAHTDEDGLAVLVELPATPAALIAGVREERAAGRPAQAELLLQEAGRRNADQVVAGLLLRLAGADARLMLRGASARPFADIWAILEVLREMEAGHLADDLLREIADGAAARTVEVIHGLRDRPGAGQRLSDQLLQHAIALAAEGHPGRVIDLVSTLSARGLPDVAGTAVDQAIKLLKGDDAAQVADTLREAGRDGEAARLYAAAIPAIVDREPQQLAEIARHMSRRRLGAPAVELAVRAARRATTAPIRARLLLAFAGGGLDEPGRALIAELATLPEDELEPIAAELFRNESNEAVRLYVAAAGTGSAARLIRLVEHLLDNGRVRDAGKLVGWAAGARDDHDLAELASRLAEPYRAGLLRKLIEGLLGEALAGFYLLAREQGGDLPPAVERAIPNLPDDEFAGFLARLSARGEEGLAAEWLGSRRDSAALIAQSAFRTDPGLRRALIPVLTRISALADCVVLVVSAELASGDTPPWTLASLPPPSISAVVSAFDTVAGGGKAGVLQAHLAVLPPGDLRRVLVAVTRHGGRAATQRVLEAGVSVTIVLEALGELPPDHRAELIDAFRGKSTKNDLFRLGALLRQAGRSGEAQVALAGHLFLPIEAAGDPVAMAVAEHLHHFSFGHGLTDRYPVSQYRLDELVALGQLERGETCLLLLRLNLYSKRRQIVFTSAQARHWEPDATPVGYRELGTLGDIGVRKRHLTFRSADGDLPFRGWQFTTAEEATAVGDLFRAVQRIVRSFVSDT
ncbi:caspase, EACC1-associated type [Actinoplanes sp. CA-131856]